jgi:hypothetical protein
MELASCKPSEAEDFEMAPRFLENLCTPVHNQFLVFKNLHIDTIDSFFHQNQQVKRADFTDESYSSSTI